MPSPLGDIPDMFIVTNQNDLVQLAESELIMPVDDVVDKYFTTWDKEIQNSDGGMLYEMASYDGQRYGIPCNISDTDTFSYIWLRKDWMEAAESGSPQDHGRPEEHHGEVRRRPSWAATDNTYGLLIDKALYYSTRGLFAGFKRVSRVLGQGGGRLAGLGRHAGEREAGAGVPERACTTAGTAGQGIHHPVRHRRSRR